MHMIRHDHVTHQQEFVALVNCAQRAHKQVSRTNGTQQRQSAVTTERHKVQVAAAIIAFQIFRDVRPTQEPTCNPDTWGTQHPKSPYPTPPPFAGRMLFSSHAYTKT